MKMSPSIASLAMAASVMVAVTSFQPATATAHEGHSHAGLGAEPVHGGVLKVGKSLDLELLTDGKTFKIFPLTKESRVFKMDDLKLKATVHSLGKTKAKASPHPVKLQIEWDHAAGTVDSNVSRPLQLVVELKNGNKAETFKFQVD